MITKTIKLDGTRVSVKKTQIAPSDERFYVDFQGQATEAKTFDELLKQLESRGYTVESN
jgi:hypothetical protein